MKIKFIKEFPTNLAELKVGTVVEVINKKEPDKHQHYIRYQIKVNDTIGTINIPEMFVEEVVE